MVRPFEKPHGRLPRQPSVPSPSRNHHERKFFIAAHPELSRRTRLGGEFSEVIDSITPTFESSI
jgi:hypothetical protein